MGDVANITLTMLWFVAVTNAFQFLDGMDGLAAGLGVIAGVFFSMTALQTDQRHLMYLAAALVGACLGFLPFNFRPGGASIFLGDAGASFIGFTLAGLAVMGEWAENDPIVALLTPVLILGVPLFDIAFVSVARVATGRVHSPHEWLAYTGKDHVSALLLWHATMREAMLVLLQAACVLAIIAVLEAVGRGRAA